MSAEHGPGAQRCREMFARLSEYIDGELDPEICAVIEGHMDDCAPCEAFLESLRRTVDLARDLPPHELPEGVARELVEAYRRTRESRDSRESDFP